MTLSAADILELETVSARAWPAARRSSLGGWRLNATSGFSDRINTCWPLGDPGLPLDDAVDRVETWYARQGRPCQFKIVDEAGIALDLTGRLGTLGYRPRTETIMMIGPSLFGERDPDVRLSGALDETFEAVFAAAAPSPGDAAERLETLARVPAPRALATVGLGGVPAAIGACAADGGWAGLFAMRTDPAWRRRGLARRVLASLLSWAAEAGARQAWLQVEADNAPAIALYRAAGFVDAYRYRYWRR